MPAALPALFLAAFSAAAQQEDVFAERVAPVLERHCVDCHAEPGPAGELDLSAFADESAALLATDVWPRVRRQLATAAMPPPTVDERPDASELAAVLDWIEERFPGEAGSRGADSGEAGSRGTTLRRLNRDEYRHALLDLLGVAYPAHELFPADGVGHGFDVVGDVLSLSPLLYEKLFEAAEHVARTALPPEGEERLGRRRIGPTELDSTLEKRRRQGDLVVLYSNGRVSGTVRVERAGEYVLRVRAGEQHAGPDFAAMEIAVDGRPLARVAVEAHHDDPRDHEARVALDPGAHVVSAAFLNDYYRPEAEDPQDRDRNLAIFWIELVGPLDAPRATPFERAWRVTERPARDVLADVAPLLWRSPVDREMRERLLALAGDEADDRERLHQALVALLVSPRFLFRVEPPPETRPWRPLSGPERATRLAAFLWSSVPDAALLAAAADGALDVPASFHAVVDGMLADARASRLATSFAVQWLELRRLDELEPDPARFPTFDDELRTAMRRETELFFEAVLREDRRVSELLRADFTFLNERLAEHYGVPGVTGAHLRRVALPVHLAGERGGLLGHASVLTATSSPLRTSPVLRGKWVLDALLATPSAPPPPGVGVLDESAAARDAASLRERLEAHRADAVCAVCHAPMDGLGFALEPYDAIGRWRETDGGFPIDARAELPGDVRFEGPEGLREHLLGNSAFLRGLACRLATFALGRGLGTEDRAELDWMLAELPADPTLRALVHGILDLQAWGRRYREEPER